MKYSVKWSEKAQGDYLQIIDYLIENWGRKSAKNFKDTVEHIVDIISKIPELYPETDYRENLRRCVVVKQVSMYYQINKSEVEIYIVRMLDNRQNPDNITDKIDNE